MCNPPEGDRVARIRCAACRARAARRLLSSSACGLLWGLAGLPSMLPSGSDCSDDMGALVCTRDGALVSGQAGTAGEHNISLE